MKSFSLLTLYSALLLAATSFLSFANATAGIDGSAKSVYFEANHDHNSKTNQHDALALAHDWRIYLQAHRFFKKSPPKTRLNLSLATDRRGEPYEFKSLSEQLGVIGLSEMRIQAEPTGLYTLQIAAFAQPQSVRRFVLEHWVKSGAEKRLIYSNTPKQLALSVTSGDLTIKDDPLYQQKARVGTRQFNRIRYGAYENTADAARDLRQIERTTGLRAQIVPCALSPNLVEQMWLEPLANRFIGRSSA